MSEDKMGFELPDGEIPANNRISTSGYTYDNNGNMTQCPS